MAEFQPYSIIHVELNKIETLQLNSGNHYIVTWCNQVPLGHVWLERQQSFSSKNIIDAIKPSIEKAIAVYLHNDNWQQILQQGDFVKLHQLLSKSIDDFKINLSNETAPISVVVCTRNRPQALQKCISSLLNNDDKNFELIIVDNAPDNDDAKKIVAQFAHVRYVREEKKGLDIARNTGAKSASHNIIAYTDDDVQIPANWISNIKTCFSNPLTMAVTGLVIPAELNTEAQYIFEKDWGFNKGYVPTTFDHKYFLAAVDDGVPAWDVGAGANMAFRREAFNLGGLFDERLDVGAAGCSGDSEMWYRILAEGWNCVYYPHVYVFHEHRKSLKDLRKQLFNYMKGHVCALLVQHEKYGHKGNIKRVQSTLPAYYRSRFKQEFKKILSGRFSSLFTEIKGCRAGKKFYNKHKSERQKDVLSFPQELLNDIIPKEHPLVSIIIPCYNQAHYLTEAINSAINQTYKHIEVVVVDDGSTDNTKNVCDSFTGIIYVRVERVGLSAARNIGVQFSKGDYLVFLDADDYLYPGAVEVNLYFFNTYKQAAFVSGIFDKIDAAGNYLNITHAEAKTDLIYISLLQGNYIGMEATVMYRRGLFFYFCFDTQLLSCEDYDLNLRISRKLPAIHHQHKIAVYRMHASNMSNNNVLMLKTALSVLKKQEKFLLNNEEKNAHAKGIQNWIRYYS